jgi:hypothetical protein
VSNMEAKTELTGYPLTDVLDGAESIARTAGKHRHPLVGAGFYATKFSDARADAAIALKDLAGQCKTIDTPAVSKAFAVIEALLTQFFEPKTTIRDRAVAKQQVFFQLKTVIQPALVKASSHAPSDKFFPLELVVGTRPYIEKVARQACGCYDLAWYDAASVMARRMLETLIIELYESKKLDAKLKKPDGTFLPLSGLISVLLAETTFNISRNTKKALPRLKDLGDQSAHNRRYIARQRDLDDVRRDLRVMIEELVHLTAFR